jgi:acylphosphatase
MTDKPDSPSPERPVALLVHYAGRVQGVGFRATAAALARDYSITGWVKNLWDGRVQLHAEGPHDKVRAFLADVRSRFRGYIEDEQIEKDSPSGPSTRFEIAH